MKWGRVRIIDGRGAGGVFDPVGGQQLHPSRSRGPKGEIQFGRNLFEVGSLREGEEVLLVPDAPWKVDRKPGPGFEQEKNGAPLEGVFLNGVRHVGRIDQHLVANITRPVMTSGGHNIHARC